MKKWISVLLVLVMMLGLAACGAAPADDAGYQHHAGDGCQRAYDLLPGQPLFEHQRGKKSHYRRLHIVAQRRGGNGGIPVGFKQQDPVKADGRTGNTQQRQILFHGGSIGLKALQLHPCQQKHRADRTAHQRDRCGWQRDPPHKQADGAENGHGRDHADFCFFQLCFCSYFLVRQVSELKFFLKQRKGILQWPSSTRPRCIEMRICC